MKKLLLLLGIALFITSCEPEGTCYEEFTYYYENGRVETIGVEYDCNSLLITDVDFDI